MLYIDTKSLAMITDHNGPDAQQAVLTAGYNIKTAIDAVMNFFLWEYFPVSIILGLTTTVQGTLPSIKYDMLVKTLQQEYDIKHENVSQTLLGKVFSMPWVQDLTSMVPSFLGPYTSFTFHIKVSYVQQAKRKNAFAQKACEIEKEVDDILLETKCADLYQRISTLRNASRRSAFGDPLFQIPPPPKYSAFSLSGEWRVYANRWFSDSSDVLQRRKAARTQAQPPASTTSAEVVQALAAIGLPPDFDTTNRIEVKKAWKTAILAAHPDKGGSDEKQQRVNEAKQVLEQHGILGSISRFHA